MNGRRVIFVLANLELGGAERQALILARHLSQQEKENTFAAPVVKMQKQRGQKVISTGLYAVVRHPMYAGATLLFISGPLLLGSLVGLALALLLIATIVTLAFGEETMLKQELEGYSDYMRKVKWRIIPYVF